MRLSCERAARRATQPAARRRAAGGTERGRAGTQRGPACPHYPERAGAVKRPNGRRSGARERPSVTGGACGYTAGGDPGSWEECDGYLARGVGAVRARAERQGNLATIERLPGRPPRAAPGGALSECCITGYWHLRHLIAPPRSPRQPVFGASSQRARRAGLRMVSPSARGRRAGPDGRLQHLRRRPARRRLPPPPQDPRSSRHMTRATSTVFDTPFGWRWRADLL